ncbi:hypothetical protein DMA11_14390 [Marinilabiliaceae bacterium JC017]|nr:hypothetical protein DMA11_14390 [Marinilabiliaceae bacterium JC017]
MANNENPEEKKKLQGGFKKLLSNIGNVIEDAASLEVTTFTGDYSYKSHQVINNGVNKVAINDVLKLLAVENQTDLKLVAYTNVKIDSDVSTIVKSNLSAGDAELLKLHQEMIKSSKESRQAIIDMVKDLI